jgi:hypothetical protein
LNQGPAGLQPDALPLSYISRYETVGKHVYTNRCADVCLTREPEQKSYLSEVGFEPTPSYEDQNSHSTLPIKGARFEP